MRVFIFLILLFFSFGFQQQVKAEEMVSVRLVNYIEDTKSMTIKVEGNYLTLDPTLTLKSGKEYLLSIEKDVLRIQGDSKLDIRVKDSIQFIPESYDQQHKMYINNRPYLGAMEFKIEEEQYIRPVNQLPLEDYLKGVVPFEVFPSWDLEALKAQALAARTYAVSNLHKQMNDTIQYQVYGGYDWRKSTTKAVVETEGEVISFNNRLIEAFYSASNGGVTENNANVWGGKSVTYFPIKNDPYDPVSPWKFTLNENQIEVASTDWNDPKWWEQNQEIDKQITSSIKKWLQRDGFGNDIKVLTISKFQLSNEQLESKRFTKGSIKVEFLQRLMDGTILYNEVQLDDVNLNKIRPMLGGSRFKSYFIDSLDYNDGVYTMKGRGYGHGVGMSQWGASVMGEQGKSYKEIIEFYFPGTKILQYDEL